jgi:hypothetical protein
MTSQQPHMPRRGSDSPVRVVTAQGFLYTCIPKENTLLKKKIGAYDDNKYHLINFLNFHGLQVNPPAVVCKYKVSKSWE